MILRWETICPGRMLFSGIGILMSVGLSFSQCVSGGQKFREVILRKCSDSAEYTPKLVNICSDSMKNTPPYLKVILRKCSDSAEYTLIFFDNQKEMVHYFVKEGLLLATFCPFYCKKGCIIHYIFFTQRLLWETFVQNLFTGNTVIYKLVSLP